MSTLAARYTDLKTQVGGNREMTRFEHNYGGEGEDARNCITLPAAHIRRIFGELEFAMRLSSSQEHRFDGEIDSALTLLEDAMREDGTLTRAVCLAAEQALSPMEAAAKEYELILVGHAHIDMNWMWSWQETVAATLATFRTMLDIMDEYPQFCFSQSQASVYQIVEEYDPEMMARIKQRIAEGRWEITASAWVETDKNMPNTESLLRHIQYTKTYLRDHWGIDPASLEIDFSPDTFGHSANLPELDTAGGVKYYYHCRALEERDYALYRWRGQSGQEILCYRERQWYNSGIRPKIGPALIEVSKHCAGLKTGMVVYGVGDHGGGPTRRDVERGIEMMDWPIFPRVKFGTMREFFHKAEAVRDQLPLVDHEINFIFPGCYTTQSRIKMGNRASERALASAEGMNALATLQTGAAYPQKDYESAWQNTLFTHFHDILTGSCVQESREYAMGLYSRVLATAQTQMTKSALQVTDAIDTSAIPCGDDVSDLSQSAGVGYGVGYFGGMPRSERGTGKVRVFTVFNPTAVKKSEPVELTVWDWTGDMRRIRVTDAAGNEKRTHLLDGEPQHYWAHFCFRLLVPVTVEPFGYTTLVLRERELGEDYPLYLNADGKDVEATDYVLENSRLKAVFNRQNGRMISLFDKTEQKERLRGDAGLCLIDTERATSDAWHIGRWRRVHPVDNAVVIRMSSGPLRSTLTAEYKVGQSTLRVIASLTDDAPAVAYRVEADWRETAGGESVPVLVFSLPLKDAPTEYLYDIPGGVISRPPLDHDVPGLQFALAPAPGGKNGVGIVSAGKYGYRGTADGTLTSTLINSAANPDPYPEFGRHTIQFHVGIFGCDPKVMEDTATSLNSPLTYQPARGTHGGTLPTEGSLLSLDSAECVISSVSMDGDALLVRLYNVTDQSSACRLTCVRPVKAAETVDLLGEQSAALTVEDGAAVFTVPAHALRSIRVTF